MASTTVDVLTALPAAAATNELYSWGYNAYGQLGTGNTATATTPVKVQLPAGVTATTMSSGGGHSVAIGSDGKLYAWGLNSTGQLGTGDTTNHLTPVVVTLPSGVTAVSVAAGEDHSVIAGSDGNVYDWGYNAYGQLGDGTLTGSLSPELVSLPAGTVVTKVAAGAFFTMALTSTGSVYVWGYAADGELCNSVKKATQKNPILANSLSGITITAIAAGGYHDLFLASDGTVYSCGYDAYGQLGNGGTTDQAFHVHAMLPAGVTGKAIAAGQYHSMAIGSDNKLYSWGYNSNGQLGNGSTTNSTTPVVVSLPAGVTPKSIAAGNLHSLAIGSDGNLYGWGYNGLGQLGDGNTTDAHSPVQVNLTPVAHPPTVVASGPSADHSFVVAPPTPAPTTTTLVASPTAATYGQSVTLSATVSPNDGGGTVTFSNGVSTISGCGSVALTHVGSSYQATCTTSFTVGTQPLSASYAGDTLYATSTSSTVNFVVSPAPLLVTASSASTTYGSTPPAVTPSYSGFVSGDTAASLSTQPTCSTTATSSSPAGSYATSCSGAVDPQYTITYQGGTLTVGAAPLTITASSGTATYGSTPPAVTPSYSGFVNGDTVASLTTPPTCSTAATSASPVGTYPTSCSGAVDPNYAVTYAAGSMVVGQAPLLVTASSASTTYGTSPPAVTPSYSGFANGDSASSLTTQPTCSTAATSASPVGTYPTSCSGAVDPNYAISYAGGSLTVDPAPLTVTASSGTMTYGGTVPSVTPIVSGLQNGENVSVLGAGLGCSTPVTSSSPVGTYATSCSGAADGNYTITYVAGSIVVSPAPLTVTASSGTMTYGGAVPVITAIVSGLQNGEGASVLGTGLTCSTSASPASPVGTYTATCSGAFDANYTIGYVAGTVTIGQAPLTVTASSGSMTYGGAAPTISATVSGLQNGETASVLGGGLLCSSAAGSSSPVGTYASTCTGAVDANYQISYVAGSVDVGPAPLVVTASSPTVTYGSAPPAIVASYSGFVNGDTAAALTTAPTCSTPASASSPVGSYPSSCSGAVDPNYTISYTNGSVTVATAALVVTASSGSMTYGGSVPTISPSYSGFVNGDTAASLTAQATCGTAATSSSAVGTYGTSCAGAADPNYAISYVSGVVEVDQAPLSIAASSGTMTYGGSVPTVTPSYSGFVNGDTAASLAAQPTCSTTATSASAVGSYPTACSGAVDPDYAITYVGGSIVVGSAQLVIVASSSTMTYGGSVPTVTPSYSGFVNGDTAASLAAQPTCSTTATSGSPVGSYPTTCAGAAASNYTITYVGGTVAVGPAPLSIAASSGSMTYGGSVPTVSPSYAGFVNGDTTASLTASPACSTTATSGSAVGSYSSTCSGAVDANYTFTYVGGTIAVNPAHLTVTASSPSTTYGSAPATISPSYAGFVNGDTAVSLSAQPVCTTGADASSPVGTYPSTCSGAADANYSISYVAGTVTVGPAPLTIAASSDSITYGGAAPTITASYTGFVDGQDATVLTALPMCSTSVTSVTPVGTYASSCTGAVDPNYSFEYLDGSVVVEPSPLTITASSGSSVYGSPVPAVTALVSGLHNGEDSTVLGGGLVCSTVATSSSPVGTYPTTCTGAVDANYAITYDPGTMQVGPASLIVGASSGTSTYGSAVAAVTPSYAGFVNGDTAASLTTPPACSTTATASSPVGTYPTSCEGASDANYVVSYVGGTAQITPATLAVAASSATTTYGSAPPAVTPSYSGFVNGDTAASLTTSPVCSTTATAASPVGTYATSCSGANDANYVIGYTGGTVEVDAAPLSVAASSATSTYGSAPPAVTPSYSGFVNGDTASSLTTPATCSTTATVSSPAGTYPTSCSGAVDPNYAITYTGGSLVVGAAELVIAASSGTTTYGVAPATVTPSYSGFVNGDGPSSLTTAPTCSTTASATTSVGTYPTSCSGAVDPNYHITYVSGSETVGPAPLTITAPSATTNYGESTAPVTASYTGFVNGDGPSSLTAAPSCSTTATASSAVGTYPTACSGAVDPNYAITYVSGTDTVGPAPLTITASSGTMTYGGTPPTVSASFSGFVLSQGPSVLGAGLTCTTTAVATSAVGTYPASCSGAVDPNYTITYVPGSVTVTPAALVVTAANQTIGFGSPIPPLTSTITGFVNGQTLSTSGVTGSPSCTTTATASSPVGSYPITCSLGTLAAQNYVFTFVPGTLTVTAGVTSLCSAGGVNNGAIVITAGQSVLIPPGCRQNGNVSVETGGSLDAEGAIINGSVSFSSGAVLRVCSTNLSGQLISAFATGAVVVGDGTSSCLGSVLRGGLTATYGSGGVSVNHCTSSGSIAISANSGGVALVSCSVKGSVGVTQNTGGATVVNNTITGTLTVTGNTGTVVDHPNQVGSTTTLQ